MSRKGRNAGFYSVSLNVIGCNQFKSDVTLKFKLNHCKVCCSLSLHVRFLKFCQNKYVAYHNLQDPRTQKKQDYLSCVWIAAQAHDNDLTFWSLAMVTAGHQGA